ncbi:LysM peptidoglycan-binding domain-containing protein [Anaerotignum faecicola]|nr:LysM peptidoglycan-binding domain-containing protein [Anaerotignum faecicola]
MYKFIMDGVQFPVAPSKFSVKTSGKNETVELVSGGEASFLKSPGLVEFSFDVLLPYFKYPFAEYPDGFKDPAYYISFLDRLFREKRPFYFSVIRDLPNGKVIFDTDIRVSLENFSRDENADEGFDITASIELKQYPIKDKTILSFKTDEEGNSVIIEEKEREIDKETPEGYTVQKGDSLWAICKAQLGDGSKCWEIAELNGIANPRLIYPGQVIKFE